MKPQIVACQACAAPLPIFSKTNFVTCSYCQVSLIVRRNNKDIYTEKLEELERQTQKLAVQVSDIQYEASLKRLEKEFKPKGGPYATTFVGFVFAGLGVFMVVSRWLDWPEYEGSYLLYGMGGIFSLIGIFLFLIGFKGIATFSKEFSAYQERKNQLFRKHYLPSPSPAASLIVEETNRLEVQQKDEKANDS